MDYRKTAQDILDHVGGSKNIASAAHCATRLRLVIADNKKVSKEALENVDGVKGVFEASGQLQIILGTGTVNKVFAEFIDIAGITASSKAEAKEAAAEKQNWFMRAIKLLGDIFVPIIPAIVASGFLMGIMNSLDFMNSNGFLHINTHSSIYVFANLFSNIAYTFLQILIAFSAAKAFGANQYLGAVIGMIMIHPSLQNAYTVATEGVQQTQSVFFGLFKIDMVGYQGHVIPVIIAVWILAVIEKKLHKIVPEVLDLFVTPLVSVFVTGYLTLSIVGPIFVWAENAILGAIQWMLTLPLGIGSLIMGGLYAPTVVTGIHQMYTAIDIGQLAKYGVTYWLPLASAANVAQGAAALAVGIKSKDKKIKSLALPSSLSAFMGITEPAIFGVNLRFFKPFIAGCIGGGCGALYASLVHLGAKGTGVTGIFGILLCLNQPLQYLIEMVIAVGVAFVISFLIYKDAEPKAATADAAETAAVENMETTDAVATADTTAETAEETLTSPVNGTQIPLAEVADETFASEMLGATVAVEPADGKIVAPCDGEVSNIFETGHAVCITTESGGELLIHIGIDTVKMDGKGFTKKVSDGDKVHAGDILVEADLEEIKNAGYQTTTMMILTNTDEFGNVTKAEPTEVKTTSKVMTLTK
ncbi:PTS transporter subunit EIIC [Dorea longicatena]|uniref:PTS beta-glucoside transporter subunit IIBCA n=1 Tax=Dorea longicatena TaxID=88431 RepID=UPI00156F74F3|nr:PTS beta-glucoside transporter subunit IIBCA [Dorea longicatena]NSD05898.1 PTS transporter subunit EIIC [Dorea longicatena]NSD17719.1 PTS transporter subunit EIIC [Dorea longicatena]NSK07724.1 PTS transporter subunit EIIC [Blautia sp. MSK.20.9]